jgi:hypothetical protein
MKFFNTEVLDVKIPDNDELFNLIKYLSKYNIDINSLLYFAPTTNYLNLLKLNLTKEQKVLITYRKIFTRNYEEIEVAAKAGYINHEELLTVIYLLKDNYYNEQSFLYKCILLHTDFKPDKKVFDYINEELIFQMTEIQEIINIQWKKGNKDVLYFCDKIYKESKPLLFFYFPVEIDSLKEYFDKKIDEGLIDKELNIICSIDIDRNRRINLLKKYCHLPLVKQL